MKHLWLEAWMANLYSKFLELSERFLLCSGVSSVLSQEVSWNLNLMIRSVWFLHLCTGEDNET